MIVFVAIVGGLVLGSFLSVLLERWPYWQGVSVGRSQCPHCHHVLVWYDLVPLLSWVVLCGRCQYCNQRISFFYPLLELTMATVLAVYVKGAPSLTLWMISDIVVLFGLVSLFFFDLRWRILPDVSVFGLSGVLLARLISFRSDFLIGHLVTGLILVGVLGALYRYSRGRWLGLGDVKMAMLIGLLFGWPNAVGVTLIAVWIGALVGVGLMVSGRATMKTALPFGTFWAAVAIVAILWPSPVAFLSGLMIPVF